MKEGILFGNFIGKNNDGKVFAECINISEKTMHVPVPEIELLEFEMTEEADPLSVHGDDAKGLRSAMIRLFDARTRKEENISENGQTENEVHGNGNLKIQK